MESDIATFGDTICSPQRCRCVPAFLRGLCSPSDNSTSGSDFRPVTPEVAEGKKVSDVTAHCACAVHRSKHIHPSDRISFVLRRSLVSLVLFSRSSLPPLTRCNSRPLVPS